MLQNRIQKKTNICIEVPEGKEKGPQKIFEETIAENFLNMGKEIVNHVQKAQRVLGRINPRRNTLRRIVTKLTKTKDRDKLLTATGEKKKIQGDYHKVIKNFSTETLQARVDGTIYSKRRTYNQEYSTQQDSHSDLMEKSKAFQTSKREFSTTKPKLKKLL